MEQALLNVLTHTVTTILGSLAVGWLARRYYINWRYGPPKDSVEIVRDSLMYKIAAEQAINRLTVEEKLALEEEVTEEMKEHYGEGSVFRITDVEDER